ncbi:FAD-dependent oxidoreductase [Pantoea vagans]|uniref:FAD-dependent oxidoreductase n=1 Tax=Pantoea vagans TaxID=470934 RepID=UPI00289BA585|nr:NAD(P)/FAD-dependent oxidoreductase [Pantoea vagans]
MLDTLSIAIIGGGPAGLTAAVILEQNGFDVTVFEEASADSDRSQGGSLDLHPDSGQEALRRAGLLQSFRKIARHEDQQSRMINHRTGETEEDSYTPEGEIDKPEIDRGELKNLLQEALSPETIQWGHKLHYVDYGLEKNHGLMFRNGRRYEADIVIGADGAWSRVRAYLTPERPRYSGITFFEGWINQPSVRIDSIAGKGTAFSFGGSEALVTQRNGGGRICVYAAMKRDSDVIDQHIVRQDISSYVRSSYQGWDSSLQSVISATGEYVRRPIYSLPVDFGWAPRPGITLIGDAAHLMPPVGVGVNLAMLDASDVALALCEASHPLNGLRYAETRIMERARDIMPAAISGFQDWFSR